MKQRNNQSKSKLLIFDFDGTIADTKSLYYKAIYDNLKKFGFSYKSVDKAIDLGETLKGMLNKLGFSFITSAFLKRRIMKKVIHDLDKTKKCKDVDSIKLIKQRKILVTNSLKEAVLPILKHFKLKREFKEIYGARDFRSKPSFINKYLKEHNIDKKDCYYIGDRVADAKVAKKVGCNGIIILGKCAWDSKKELLAENPDFVVESIKDIKKIVD